MKNDTHEKLNRWLATVCTLLNVALLAVHLTAAVHPRPPMDNFPAHSTRLWTASLPRGAEVAHRLPTTAPYGPDAPLRGLPK